MKTLKLLSLLIFFPVITYCQTDLIKKTVKNTNRTEETFYVLKSNTTIRQGEYKKQFNGKLLEEGVYENGQKGIWSFYNENSQIYFKYDFINDSVTYLNLDTTKYMLYLDKTIRIKADRPALPLISEIEMFSNFNSIIKYPEKAIEEDKSGTVEIGIQIDSLGLINNYIVLKSVDSLLDDEALRVVKIITKNITFLPAVQNGVKITSYYILPVNFVLNY